jgi:hypothetical protein
MGAKAIQKTKEAAPVAAAGVLLIGGVVAGKKFQGQEKA